MLIFDSKKLFYVVERGVWSPRVSITCGHCHINHSFPSGMDVGFIHTIDAPYHLNMVSAWKQAQEVAGEEGRCRHYHPEENCKHFINGKLDKVFENFIIGRFSEFAITSCGYFAWFDKGNSDEAILIPLADEDKDDVYLAFTSPIPPYYNQKLMELMVKYWTLAHQFIKKVNKFQFMAEFKSNHG